MAEKLKAKAVISEPEEQDAGYGEFGEHEVEHAVSVLMEAEKIRGNKELLKYAKQCMQKKMNHMGGVVNTMDGLKEKIKSRNKELDEE
jgi:hypothetical protein